MPDENSETSDLDESNEELPGLWRFWSRSEDRRLVQKLRRKRDLAMSNPPPPICTNCGGSGQVGLKPCPVCHGSGQK